MLNASEDQKEVFEGIELPTADYQCMNSEQLLEVLGHHERLEILHLGNRFVEQQQAMKAVLVL